MRSGDRRVGAGAGLVAAGLALLLGACSFDVSDPTRLTDGDIHGDAMMTALAYGAITSYDQAFDRLSMITALLSDEFVASGSWIGWHRADKEGYFDLFDSESDHINISWVIWRYMARARGVADEVYGLMEEELPDISADPRAALMRLYSGLAITNFAENFCQAAYDGGPVVETAESYSMAESKLNDAIRIAQAAGADSIVDRARLVLARIHLARGERDAALAAARAVPDGFRWVAHFRDSPGERAFFWGHNAERGELSVAPRFYESGDPRTPAVNQGRKGPDNQTDVWAQQKYPTRNHDWVIGNWQEARLIEAELILEEGDVDGAIELLNEVRAASGLDPFELGASAAEATTMLRQERAFELWMHARRYHDMRRWNEFPANWVSTCIPISREEKDSNDNLRNVRLTGWP